MVHDDLIKPEGVLPGPIDHRKEAGVHHAKLRLLQFDIHERLNKVAATRSPSPPVEWFNEMRSRLEEWYHAYNPTAEEYMNQDWLDLHLNITLSLLYRPSPGNSRPNRDFLLEGIKAAGSIIRVYKTLWRRRALNFIWLAIHHVFMAGVTYLNSIWIANSEGWSIVTSYIDAILDIQTCSQVLEAMSGE